VVPVLRDADQMSFSEIEKAIGDFSGRAREGKLGLDEMTGGSFTLIHAVDADPQCAPVGHPGYAQYR
jgi:pyruvate/2-oxoglutarate dehydrogenase complex dihydrolipoamide acyltransferase (E2) component